LELSDREYIITMRNMPKDGVEKAGNMYEQMGVSAELWAL
jgi:hypothetical protein